jgi:hypothetical protein
VDGNFSQDREWLVERNLIANNEDSFFSIPNTLISARKPAVPVSNMSDRPRFIRKGEILGTLTDPQEFFNKPTTESAYKSMVERTSLLAAMIQAKAEADQSPSVPDTQADAGSSTRIRTDFGSGVPPNEENRKKGVHVRDDVGRVPDAAGNVTPELREAEDYGPKTAAMPDNTLYPSAEMENLLDVGSLPEDLKPKAWEMLRR